MPDEYIIPFGIDANPYLKGISDMEDATDGLVATTQKAGKEATAAFTGAANGTRQATQAIREYSSGLGTAEAQTNSLFQLDLKLKTLQADLFNEKDIARIKEYNAQIQATQKQISGLQNVGKAGFDDLGNQLNKVGDAVEGTTKKTNLLSKGFGFVRQAAYLIPGIGIAGIFNLIGESVIELTKQLINAGDGFDQINEKVKLLSTVQQTADKAAGKQLTDLQFLYAATQDVTKSTKDRTDAVVALQAEFPEAFKNISTEAILNGDAKDSYDKLTVSILASARATAAKSELDKIAGQILDIEFQKEKIRNANAQENANAKDEFFSGAGGGASVSKSVVVSANDARAKDALKEQDILEGRLKNQQDFLVKFAGGEQAIVKVIEDSDAKKIKSNEDAADKLAKIAAQELLTFTNLAAKLRATDDSLQAKAIDDNEASQLAQSDAHFKKIADDAQREVDNAKVNNAQRVQLQQIADKVIQDSDAAAAAARLDIQKKYQDQRLKLQQSAQAALDSITQDPQDKELAAINKHYSDLTATIKKGGLLTAQAQIEIENARIQAIDDVDIKFGSKQISDKEKLDIQAIEVDQKYADKSVGIQKEKSLAILAVELKAAQDQLALLQTNGKDETDTAVKNAEALIKNLQSKIAAVQGDAGKPKSLFSFLGIDPDSQADIEKYAKAASTAGKVTSDFLGALIDSNQQALDAKQKSIDQENQDLDDLQTRIDKEMDLRNQGLANNVDNLQKEQAAKQKQRDADLKSQKELQDKQNALKKAQIIADSVAQVSNLITAATEIFAAFAEIPIVGVPLAIAAIGLMFGAFAVAKVNALKSVGASTQAFGEGGYIDGPAHTQGGKKYRAVDGSGLVELEGGEHVTNKRSTKKYSTLLDAINSDDLSGMSEDGLRTMFADMGIGYGIEGPREAVKVIHKNAELKQQFLLSGNPNEGLGKDVKNIGQDVKFLADKERGRVERWEDAVYTYEKRGNKTIKVKK